jgi:hypothetical protein
MDVTDLVYADTVKKPSISSITQPLRRAFADLVHFLALQIIRCRTDAVSLEQRSATERTDSRNCPAFLALATPYFFGVLASSFPNTLPAV